MLQYEARDIRVLAGQDELREAATHRLDRPHEVLEDVGVVDADLQHDPARHALGGIAPRAELELPEPVARDVRLGIDELAEHTVVDSLADPAKVAFLAPLVSEREHDARLAAGRGQGAGIRNRVGDRLVEKDVLAGLRRRARRLRMHVVRRRVDDRLDDAVVQDRVVARRGVAGIFFRECLALLLGARIAGDDLELSRALDGVGEHIRPPAHPDTRHSQRFISHCCLLSVAIDWRAGDTRSSDPVGGANRLHRLARKLVVELPGRAGDADAAHAFALHDNRVAAFHRRPALGARREREPESVQRVERLSGGAFGRRRALVGRGANGLGGGGVHSVESPAVHALDEDGMAAGVHDGDRDRVPGRFRPGDRGVHHLPGTGKRETLGIRDVHRSPEWIDAVVETAVRRFHL